MWRVAADPRRAVNYRYGGGGMCEAARAVGVAAGVCQLAWRTHLTAADVSPPSVPDIYPLILGICPLDKFLTFLDEKRFDKHFLKRKNVYVWF